MTEDELIQRLKQSGFADVETRKGVFDAGHKVAQGLQFKIDGEWKRNATFALPPDDEKAWDQLYLWAMKHAA